MIFSIKEPAFVNRQVEIQHLRAIMAQATTGLPIMAAYLHGSVAQNREDEHSDVDIALLTTSEINAVQRSRLELDLELILIKRHVHEPDVRVINQAPLEAKAKIIKNGTLIFSGDDLARINLEQEIIQKYRQAEPVLREERASYIARALSQP